MSCIHLLFFQREILQMTLRYRYGLSTIPTSDVFMEDIETIVAENAQLKLRVWLKYIDDNMILHNVAPKFP